MSDLISRQDALDAVKKLHWFNVEAKSSSSNPWDTDLSILRISMDVGAVRRAIEDVPAAQEGWISVKDRMPETQDWYLVFAPTYSGGSSTSREHHRGVMFAKWSGKSWSIERCYYNRPDCVKAWMPLPEPPKEEAEDDD